MVSGGGSADGMVKPRADRRLLIDGRLVSANRTFPSVNPATGIAGLEEFLERKTFAVPVTAAGKAAG